MNPHISCRHEGLVDFTAPVPLADLANSLDLASAVINDTAELLDALLALPDDAVVHMRTIARAVRMQLLTLDNDLDSRYETAVGGAQSHGGCHA